MKIYENGSKEQLFLIFFCKKNKNFEEHLYE